MKTGMNRREFVAGLAALPLAAEAALAAQAAGDRTLPIIDSHIHLFDKTRPEGAPWPRDVAPGSVPVPGMTALPSRYRALVTPFGVVGAIVVEASPRLEDNQWVLDQAATDPIIVGLVGRLDPASPDFGRNLERFRKNRLFLGIRQGQLGPGLETPGFASNLQLLADADLSLDVDTPRQGMDATMVLLRVLDRVPRLRLVMDHLPDVRFPEDPATRAAYVAALRELGKRPDVYIKLSEVVRRFGDSVSTDHGMYREWLDELWSIFGEDRVIFGSDWPNSENVERDSYTNVLGVARAYVATRGPGAMEKVFWRNSLKPYRWIRRDSTQPQA
jgi:predicted TIM-barrel fold metal-dependent hydrolase